MITRPHYRLIVLFDLLLLFLPFIIRASEESLESTTVLTDIQISFKLDPRLTRGQYMGDIWITRPIYNGANGQDTVEIKAQGLDSKGNPITINPEWIPSDLEMMTVSSNQGKEIKLTVHRAGESKLKVTSMSVSKELVIKAYYKNNIIQLTISGGQVSSRSGPAQN